MPAHAEPQPSPADPILGPLSPLLGLLLGQPEPEPAPESEPPRTRDSYGNTDAPDGVLRKGCRNYAYKYTATPPTQEWLLETFLTDRTGEGVAAGMFLSDADAATGHSTFRFCRHTARPGRFTIKAKLAWYDDEGEHVTWFEPSHFRLKRKR
ncbi:MULTISPECIES: hypothetical protein [unclassified Nocardioides]|uniref:hypothetical protein n=1 Tax=unclassified Nocardioides TaxID=2615069 RepID=UPI003607B110